MWRLILVCSYVLMLVIYAISMRIDPSFVPTSLVLIVIFYMLIILEARLTKQ